MRVKIKKQLIYPLIKALADIQTEYNLYFLPERMEVYEYDASKTQFTVIELDKKHFTEYKVEKPTWITTNVQDLKKVIKFMEEEILMETVDENARLLVTDGKRKFKTSLIETQVDMKEYNTKRPKFKYEFEITLGSQEFKSLIEEAKITEGNLWFITKDKKLTISSKSDLSSYSREIAIDYDKEIRVRYNREWFEKLNAELNETVIIKVATDFPITLDYSNDIFKYQFILGPFVDND